jgi:DNA-binding IclR family transcriptional regulator
MYHAILEWFVEHGRAPHYVELAHRLDLAAEETRRTLRELVDMGLPGVAASEHRLHRILRAVRQFADAVLDHGSQAATLVRAVRV